ncbi:MAG: hypothetical protein E6J48_06465 [Chloroflexi bacterium]|nr:MAG: hypothetical protein E6J48_06465 [Chloroflexota bacterium]
MEHRKTTRWGGTLLVSTDWRRLSRWRQAPRWMSACGSSPTSSSPCCLEREKIVEGDTVRRQWDEAQPRDQRRLSTAVLSQEQQERLQARDEQPTPLLLREEISTG